MFESTETDALLIPEHILRARLCISRTGWWRLLRDGGAPQCVLIGDRRFYRPEAVSAWLDGNTPEDKAA